MSADVVSLSEHRYRDFEWQPDPSPREGAEQVSFSMRCTMNAFESVFRVLCGYTPHPRQYTDGKGNVFWRPQ